MMIDVQAAREAYDKQEISDIGWIRSKENPAEELTKSAPCLALDRVMDTGTVNTQVHQWVVRTSLQREQNRRSPGPNFGL